MARTPSTMLMALGAPAPHFELPDPSGKVVSISSFRGKPLLVMFICNHCPYVKHLRHALAAFGKEYGAKGLSIVAINSNDAGAYPDDNPAAMAEESRAAGYTFPYLVDASQKVAQAYQAACTPDFFLFDADHQLVYRGQFDDARPKNDAPVTGKDLRQAADAVLAGKKPGAEQRASLGCNIKWKPGNEPAYFPAR
jgi:thiol-disulfide isomerase/thioredoxin